MEKYLFQPERKFELGLQYIYPGSRPIYFTPDLAGIYLNNYLDLVGSGLSQLDEITLAGRTILDDRTLLTDHRPYRVARLAGTALIQGWGFFIFHEVNHADRYFSLYGTEGLEPRWKKGNDYTFFPAPKLFPEPPYCVLEDKKGNCLEESYQYFPTYQLDDSARNVIAPFNSETYFLEQLVDQALDARVINIDQAISMICLGLFHYVYLGVDTFSDDLFGDPSVYRSSDLNDISRLEQISWNFLEVFGKGSNYWGFFSLVNYLSTGEREYAIPTREIFGIKWPLPNLNLWRAPEGYLVDWDIVGLDVFRFGDAVNIDLVHGTGNYNPLGIYLEYRTGYQEIIDPIDVKGVISVGYNYNQDGPHTHGWQIKGSLDTRVGGLFGIKFGVELSQHDLINHVMDIGRTTGTTPTVVVDTKGLSPELQRDLVRNWQGKLDHHSRYDYQPALDAPFTVTGMASMYVLLP